ncbi:LPO_1073/Vpar_1526 family protein [Laribacter hongkongensis]|uniref:LPO_1073/Vpar_1526 family protein n=1 Tax=Laribacter hongkongensis TaxID=168471 RepID=UPI001EFC5861|nr:LPO_1073/Vpar_1526 family protein [Laribacter hongkongensis]MCG9097415.1 hypothetical protein [Laribacter hongkongensis]
MINDKNLKQEGGNESTNLQAQNITINHGISYKDAKEIAIDVYKSNYLQLSQDAAELAAKRAIKIAENFLDRLKAENEHALQSMREPSMQMALYNAQKAYATTGDEDLEEVLVNILVERAAQDKRNLKQIILDESLVVAPKLTFEHMDALTLNFLLSRTCNNQLLNIDSLKHYLQNVIAPFISTLKMESSAFEHLQYAGCGSIMETSQIFPIEHIFRMQYKGLFSKGGNEDDYRDLLQDSNLSSQLVTRCLRFTNLIQINAVNDDVVDVICKNNSFPAEINSKAKQLLEAHAMSQQEVKEEISRLCPEMDMLFIAWEKTSISKFKLTTVGIAIARANLKRKTGLEIDLGMWIK